MKEYHKIQTLYLRDPATKHRTLLEGEWAKPEFGLLKDIQWCWTEKVDGTNIRIHWDGEKRIIGGRTDNAQIPTFLLSRLEELFPPEKLAKQFSAPATLYGEGYGAKIQKGGGNYKQDDVDFVLFDVFCGMWLEQPSVSIVADDLGIDRVPVLRYGTLEEAVEFVRQGHKSEWGDFMAEGLVMRPSVELLNRKGERLITKLKVKDFTR